MKRLLWSLFIVVLVCGALATAPQTSAAPRSLQAQVVQEFEWIRQGQVGLVRVSGANIASVHAHFLGHTFEFFPDPRTAEQRPPDARDWIGLVTADMTTPIAFHPVSVYIRYRNGTWETVEQEIRVAHGEFGRQELILPGELFDLLDVELNDSELADLSSRANHFRPQRLWQYDGFIQPSQGYIVSYFGLWRFFNGLRRSYRHTGIDYVIPAGTDIIAVADGTVIVAERLSIRGNYVMIDHGWGVATGYAHAEGLAVRPGQQVAQGDVLGSVGNTGRSTGPHLHFEMTVNGIWVNPLVVIPLLNELILE